MDNFKQKCQDIAGVLTKMDKNEKRIILKYIIMHDLKLYTEVLFEEQRRLEKECGIKDVEYYEETPEITHEPGVRDGFLGYVDIDGVKHEFKTGGNV